jgi:hypothetical protein
LRILSYSVFAELSDQFLCDSAMEFPVYAESVKSGSLRR